MSQCTDPWITQGVQEVSGRKVKGVRETGECAGVSYGEGHWTSYPDLMVKIRKRLAEQGDPQAQFKLGIALVKGKDDTVNLAEAYKWLSLALKSGVQEAAKEREAASAKLTASQVRRIDQSVGIWRPKL